MTKFILKFSGETELESATHIWPDGDGPANPSVDDVLSLIKEGSFVDASDFISLWNLGSEVKITISGYDTREVKF